MVLLLAAVVLVRLKKEQSGSWIQFYAKGKDAGFSFKEMELLRRLAVRCNMEDPCSLYWSQYKLDICMRSLVHSIKMSGESENQGTQEFLSRLYDYRNKIEMEKPAVKKGLSSSRQMSEGQHLRILVAGTGVFSSQIIKVTNAYIIITRPVNNKIPNISWDNTGISVYFWRDDDAGYVFDTNVTDEVFSKGVSSLKINHSDSLFRTQRRKTVRIKLQKPAFLYTVPEDAVPGHIETVPGLKCILEDMSDGGCAVTVGGRAAQGIRVKIQFAVENHAVCMIGTVRSVSYNANSNRSILHVEAEKLPIDMRNLILGEVFGMLPEEDNEYLPLRVPDDEAAGGAAAETSGEIPREVPGEKPPEK